MALAAFVLLARARFEAAALAAAVFDVVFAAFVDLADFTAALGEVVFLAAVALVLPAMAFFDATGALAFTAGGAALACLRTTGGGGWTATGGGASTACGGGRFCACCGGGS